MNYRQGGFTLIELLIVILLISVLLSAASFGFLIVLKAWSGEDKNAEIREDVSMGVQKMLRDLRAAKAISVVETDSLRFTVRESGADNHYIFYLYDKTNNLCPSASFNQSVLYQLKRAPITGAGGINGSFTCGEGVVYVKEVKPPPTSDISIDVLLTTVVSINLTVSKADETFHLLEKIRPRNL